MVTKFNNNIVLSFNQYFFNTFWQHKETIFSFESEVSLTTHEQNIICNKTCFDSTMHNQTILAMWWALAQWRGKKIVLVNVLPELIILSMLPVCVFQGSQCQERISKRSKSGYCNAHRTVIRIAKQGSKILFLYYIMHLINTTWCTTLTMS